MNIERLPDVLAYVDPGTGSMLLQLLIAGIAGALFYFRKFFAKLLSLGGGKKREEGEVGRQDDGRDA
jgi:hypothetical protein